MIPRRCGRSWRAAMARALLRLESPATRRFVMPCCSMSSDAMARLTTVASARPNDTSFRLARSLGSVRSRMPGKLRRMCSSRALPWVTTTCLPSRSWKESALRALGPHDDDVRDVEDGCGVVEILAAVGRNLGGCDAVDLAGARRDEHLVPGAVADDLDAGAEPLRDETEVVGDDAPVDPARVEELDRREVRIRCEAQRSMVLEPVPLGGGEHDPRATAPGRGPMSTASRARRRRRR